MKNLKTELIACFDRLDTGFHLALLEVQKDCRKGTIHSLRVTMKRLRAFYQLLDEIDPHFAGKMAVKKIKPLFTEAGKLRDLQIQQSLVLSHEEKLLIEHKTSEQLQRAVQLQLGIFQQFLLEYSMAGVREGSQHARSHLQHINLRTLRRGLRNYFKATFKELSVLSREGLSSKKGLHELRKTVKKLHYNLVIIDQAIPKRNLSPQLLHPLENLQNQLGKWHDYRLAIDEMKNLWEVPQELRRVLRNEEKLCLQDIRVSLVQLPPLAERLLLEADNMLSPKPVTC